MVEYVALTNQPMCKYAFRMCNKSDDCNKSYDRSNFSAYYQSGKEILKCEFRGDFLTYEEFIKQRHEIRT